MYKTRLFILVGVYARAENGQAKGGMQKYLKKKTSWIVEVNLHSLGDKDCCFETECEVKEYCVHLTLDLPIETKREEYWKHVSILDLAWNEPQLLEILKFLETAIPAACSNSYASIAKNMRVHEIRWSLKI